MMKPLKMKSRPPSYPNPTSERRLQAAGVPPNLAGAQAQLPTAFQHRLRLLGRSPRAVSYSTCAARRTDVRPCPCTGGEGTRLLLPPPRARDAPKALRGAARGDRAGFRGRASAKRCHDKCWTMGINFTFSTKPYANSRHGTAHVMLDASEEKGVGVTKMVFKR